MRRLRMDQIIRIDRPFAIFCEPSDDVPGAWLAKVVGHGLDNITQGEGPTGAVFMAFDLLRLLTGECKPGEEHDWSLPGGLKTWVGPGDDDWENVPSWSCPKCGESAAESALVDG